MSGDAKIDVKSAERKAFEIYLRTGRYCLDSQNEDRIEHKFNPYHDPENGQFTFAPGGPRSLSRIIVSDRLGLHRRSWAQGDTGGVNRPISSSTQHSPVRRHAVFEADRQSATLQPAQYRPNPRARAGNNGGPPLNDPLSLARVFPGIRSSPAGSIIGMADNILDLTGPASRLTTGLAEEHIAYLIQHMRMVDPDYRLDNLGFPTTLEGQGNLIRKLRLDRASAAYRRNGELRPLQVETARAMQQSADRAYVDGLALYEAGRLNVRLSREEAIGNYVDRMVRNDLRDTYNIQGINTSKGQPVRIVGREYDTSSSDLTYRIPDARVGNIAYDVTLTRKTLATPQVRGFFNSDFRPDSVIIKWPRQLGPGNSYAIVSPRKKP